MAELRQNVYFEEFDPKTGLSLGTRSNMPPDHVIAAGEEAIRDWYYRQRVRDEIGLESGPPRYYPPGEYPERGGDRTFVGGEPWNPNMAQHLERMRKHEEEQERGSGRMRVAANYSVPPQINPRQAGPSRPPRQSNIQPVSGVDPPSQQDLREFGKDWESVRTGVPRRPKTSDLRSVEKSMMAPRRYPLPQGVGGPFPELSRRHLNRPREEARINRPMKVKSISELRKDMKKAKEDLAKVEDDGRKFRAKMKADFGVDLPSPRPRGFSPAPGARPAQPSLLDMDPQPPPMPRLIPPSQGGGYIPMDPPPPPMPRLVPPGYGQRFQRPRAESQYAPPAPPSQPPLMQSTPWGMRRGSRVNPWQGRRPATPPDPFSR